MAFGFPHISFIGYPAPVPCPGHAGLGFREARPGDGPAIRAHLERLSPADRYRRFCAAVSDGHLAAHVEGLWQRNSFTIVGLDGPLFDGPFHRAGVVRAVIEVVVFDGVAEFGLSVDGDRRRAGVATYLILTAARLLALRGIGRMVALTQPHNHAMLGLGRSLGAETDSSADDTLLLFPVAELNGAYLRRRLGAGKLGSPDWPTFQLPCAIASAMAATPSSTSARVVPN
jgi:GNAT superfamily N-acetyltransferase